MKDKILTTIGVLFLLLAAFFAVFHDTSQFNYMNQVADHLSSEQIEQRTAIKNYLITDANIDFLSEKEQSHMYDVKRLITVAFALLLLCIAILIIYRKFLPRLTRQIGITTIATIVGLGVIITLGFRFFWRGFHFLLFPQGNWEFATTSTLITLFPEKFFYCFTIQFIIATILFSILTFLWKPNSKQKS